MAEIRVTTAEVRKKAEELRNLNSQFKQKVEALVSNEQALAAMWEGDSQRAFHNAFNNDKIQMDNFSSVMEQYTIALENIATEYDNKEALNTQIATQRTY